MRLIPVLVLLLCLVAPESAWAETSNNKAALAEGRTALTHYEEGRFEEALASFEKAEGLYHTPVFLVYIGRCQRKLGRLLKARDSFDAVLAETLDDGAPGPWKQAKVDAETDRAEVAAAIPKLTVTLNVAAEEVDLRVDGEAMKAGEATELDPGAHEVTALYDGKTEKRQVTLAEGETQTLPLTLELKAAVPPPVTPEPPPPTEGPIELPPPAPKEDDDDTSGLATAGYVLSGLGVVGLIVGAVTGGLALSENGKAGDGCVPQGCPTENEEHYDRAINFAHTSTATLAIGGAALAVGIILIIVDASGGDEAAYLTPNGVGIRF